ncbi:MAG: hypothetical protein P8J87_06385, partial [Verrucomicrobiales bacterium]|nr:hypothetical protein [Verrucomicrobiales bacterium]
KGALLHLLFFYGPVVGILIVGKRWKLLLHPAHGGGILVMLAMVLPWVFVNRSRVTELSQTGSPPGEAWAEQMANQLSFGGGGILSWILTPFEALANYLPWVILLVFLWWRISQWRWNVSPTLELQLDRTTRREWMRGAAWGIATIFLLVAFIPQSSARYFHPAIGPASMLLAVMVSQLAPGHAIYDRVSVIWKGANRVLLAGCGVVLLFAPPITLFWGSWVFPVMWFAVGCLVCGLAVFIGWKLTRRDSLVYQTGASACALAAGIQLFSIAVVPAVLEADNVRPVGRAFAGMLPETARLCVLNPGFQPFLFYLAAPYAVVAKSGEVPAESTHLLMSDEEYQKTREKPLMRQGEFTEVFRAGDKDGKVWLLFGRRNDGGQIVD